jgi:4-amino-4-deoxy-L-arabinose transferase-like glycosyltransferase
VTTGTLARLRSGTRSAVAAEARLALVTAVIAVAVGFRLAHYFGNASLRLDESRLALNVAIRSWGGLLRPLDYDQTAPPVFLWLQKVAILAGGVNELALRLPALVPGVLCVLLIYIVARRIAGNVPAVLAAGVAALSPLLIHYSTDAKPYSLDMVVTLGLVYLGLDWNDAPASSRAAARIALAGAVAVWASTPAIFVLAGIGVVLCFAPPDARPPRARLAAVGCVWAASFAIVYALVYRPVAASSYMQSYWADSLLTVWQPHLGARAWQGIRDLVWQLFFGGTTEPPVSPGESSMMSVGSAAMLVLGAVGLRYLAQSQRQGMLLLVSPMTVALGASALGLYPVAARVMLFTTPCLIIPVAVAASRLASAPSASRTLRSAAGFAGLVLLLPPLKRDLLLAGHPTAFEHVRPAVAEFRRRALPGEPIYVFTGSLTAWTFYTTDWSAPDLKRLARVARLGRSGGAAFENLPPRGRTVGTENDGLVFPLAGTREILGAGHGAWWRSASGLFQDHPDPGWAAAEARRIRAAANPSVWLLVSHSYRLELFIYPELERLGGQLEFAYGEDGVVLRRYRFP